MSTMNATAGELAQGSNFHIIRRLMGYLTENCCRGMPGDCLGPMETALARCTPAPGSAKCP